MAQNQNLAKHVTLAGDLSVELVDFGEIQARDSGEIQARDFGEIQLLDFLGDPRKSKDFQAEILLYMSRGWRRGITRRSP